MTTVYTQIGANKRKTVFLIGTFLVFIIGLAFVLGQVYEIEWLLPLAVIFSLVQALSAYYFSDRLALAVSAAKPAARSGVFLELHRTIENLAITAGIPKPKLYVISDSAPNAFATGRDPQHSSIAVTTGLVDKLKKSELEAVLAHEFSHIGNYDIRVMTIVVVLVGIVALVSDFFLRMTFWGARHRDERSGSQLDLIVMAVAIVFAVISPIIATLIQLAVSRKREFLADVSGSLLTRDPLSLAAALEKIAKDPEPLEVANRAT
ncbi:M48 family metallopeptidase, partial [Candidatus Berkelbacteria bacterium]|nr:M48 family metallopeptidase [Candidatus Berkelbacteria bacterium]